ncbi:MAG: PIN domain-containing protein [Candidatus Altiarchaeota archaeon]|nr:PIN domain-containing protein [Candidatus Altiarchaeota archaeon]
MEDFTLLTSDNVVEEVIYVLLKEEGRDFIEEDKHYRVLNFLRKNPDFVKKVSGDIINDLDELMSALMIKIVKPAPLEIMFQIMKMSGLLPNDALIAATCKFYGIKKIASFDEDFKRVDFLEIVKP